MHIYVCRVCRKWSWCYCIWLGSCFKGYLGLECGARCELLYCTEEAWGLGLENSFLGPRV